MKVTIHIFVHKQSQKQTIITKKCKIKEIFENFSGMQNVNNCDKLT